MFIDKSHSKRNLINLFNKLGVCIDPRLSKGKILDNIESYFPNIKYNDKIKNLTELKDYLKNVSPKQRPSAEKKNNIMFLSKKIIKWAKNNYIFDGSTYTNGEEILADVLQIYQWGDLPSVRKACNFYNKSNYCINHVNPIISDEVREEIQKNKIMKQALMYNLRIRHTTKENPIIVWFD